MLYLLIGLPLGALGYHIYIKSDLEWLRLNQRTLDRIIRGELS